MNQVYITIGMLSLNIFLLLFEFNTLCRASCEAVIEHYYWSSAPPYIGFNSKIEARASFESFQTARLLSAGIFFPTSLQPLNGLPVSLPPQTPQHCNRPPTPLSSCTTVNLSHSTLPHSALSDAAV